MTIPETPITLEEMDDLDELLDEIIGRMDVVAAYRHMVPLRWRSDYTRLAMELRHLVDEMSVAWAEQSCDILGDEEPQA